MTTKSIPPFLLGATVLGVASLGLTAGQAKANTLMRSCWFGTPITGMNECGTESFKLNDKTITYIQVPTSADSGDIEFAWDDLGTFDPLDDFWSVDTDFTPNATGGAPGGTLGTLKYKISIDPTDSRVFDTIRLNWGSLQGAPTVTKQVYSANFITQAIPTLTGNGQTVDISALNLKDLWILDTYTIPAGASLDNFNNVYTQVPAPLPLLGAGAAFGFSRRLRRRSKARFSLG